MREDRLALVLHPAYIIECKDELAKMVREWGIVIVPTHQSDEVAAILEEINNPVEKD